MRPSGSAPKGWGRWLLASLGCCWLLIGADRLEAQFVPANTSYEVRISDYFGQLKSSGYTTIRFTIKRIGTQADRGETLYVGTHSRSYRRGGPERREMLTRVDFEPGQTVAVVDVSCKSTSEYGQSGFVVSRDGSMSQVPRRDLIASFMAPAWYHGWRSVSATEGLGLAFFSSQPALDTGYHAYMYRLQDHSLTHGMTQGPTVETANGPAIPTFAELASVLANDSARETEGAVSTAASPDLQAAISSRFLTVAGLQAMPETWLGLSPVDVVFLSVDDLQVLAKRFPGRLEALRQWVASGGRLVISECGQDFGGLPSIVPNLHSATGRLLPGESQEWHILDPTLLTQIVDGYARNSGRFQSQISQQNVQSGYYNANWSGNPILDWLLAQNVEKNSQRLSGLPQEIARQASARSAPLLIAKLGTGRLVAVPESLAQFNADDWRRLLVASCGNGEAFSHAGIGGSQHQWTGLEGFEVRGVGQPPWGIFLVLISLFALLVGPVAFAILKRNGRPHLLLAVVPGFAAVVTTGIVAYSVIQDGLGFRTSRISVSWLDHRHEVAFVQTSQAFYAGLAPGRLELPLTTAYFDNSLAESLRSGPFRLYRDARVQSISGGRVQARTKHQVTTFEVARHSGQLRVAFVADGQRWEVTNDLGFPVEWVVARTPAGLMWAENVAVGGTAVLQLETDQSMEMGERMSRYQDQGLPEIFRFWGSSDFRGTYGRLGGTLRLLTGGTQPLGRLQLNHFVAISREQPLARDLHSKPQRELEWHLSTGQYVMTTAVPDALVSVVGENSEPSGDESDRDAIIENEEGKQ